MDQEGRHQEQKIPQEIHPHVPTAQTKVHYRGYCLPPSKSTPDHDDTATSPSPSAPNPTPINSESSCSREDKTSPTTQARSDMGAGTSPPSPITSPPATCSTQPPFETTPTPEPILTVNPSPEPRPLRRSTRITKPPNWLM